MVATSRPQSPRALPLVGHPPSSTKPSTNKSGECHGQRDRTHERPSTRWVWVPRTRSVWLLCCYVFFKSMKPSEQYLTPYLVSVKHFTEQAADDDIYPVWTYAAMIMALLAFLFTDSIGYRTVVRCEAIAYLATRVLLLWGTSLLSMQATQAFYAVATSTEIGYLSYVFCISSIADYQRVASATRVAILTAELLASITAQLSVAANHESALVPLNYVSFASVVLACLCSAALPSPVPKLDPAPRPTLTNEYQAMPSPPAPRKQVPVLSPSSSPPTKLTVGAVGAVPPRERESRTQAFVRFYTQWRNVRWSLWAAIGTCGLYQVENFNQNLWDVQSGGKSEFNGAVGAVATCLGVLAAVVPVYLGRSRCAHAVRSPEVLLSCLSIVCGAILFVMGTAASVWVGYVGYVAFKAAYCFTATMAAAQVATCAASTFPSSRSKFGMVYGFNTLLALVLGSALQFCVGQHGLHLHVQSQFQVYGGYFAVLGALFGLVAGVQRLAVRHSAHHVSGPTDIVDV